MYSSLDTYGNQDDQPLGSSGGDDGIYTYGGVRYKKSGNKWYREYDGNFVPITGGNVANRVKELNTNAKKVEEKPQVGAWDEEAMKKRMQTGSQQAEKIPPPSLTTSGKPVSTEPLGDNSNATQFKAQTPNIYKQEEENLAKIAVDKAIADKEKADKIAADKAYASLTPDPATWIEKTYRPEDTDVLQMMENEYGAKEWEAYNKIDGIGLDIILDTEENSVEELNKIFRGSGIYFEEAGIVSDQIKVISSADNKWSSVNEEVFDLYPNLGIDYGGKTLINPRAQGEQERLKEFLRDVLLKKSEKEYLNRKDLTYENMIKLKIDDPRKYGEIFVSGDALTYWLDKQSLDVASSSKWLKGRTEDVNKQIKELEGKEIPIEVSRKLKYDMDKISTEKDRIIKKQEEINITRKGAQTATGYYYSKNEEKGNISGVIGRNFVQGLMNLPKMEADLVADLLPLYFGDDATSSIQRSKMVDAGMTDTEINNALTRDLKSRVNEKMVESLQDIVSFGTTKEYVQSENRNDIEKVAGFLSESIGTAASAFGNPVLSKLAFFAQSYNAIEDQMKSSEFDELNIFEKKLMSVPYGMAIGYLERLGFKATTGGSKLLNSVVTSSISRAFTQVPTGASIELIRSAINKSVAATMTEAGLSIAAGAFVEGAVEGTQNITEVGAKQLFNSIEGKDYFKDVPDLTTKDGMAKALEMASEDFYYGMLGGLVMGAGSQAVSAVRDGYANNKLDANFEVLYNSVTDPNLRRIVKSEIKANLASGAINNEVAQAQMDAIGKSYSIFKSMPDKLSISEKREAFNLIREKQIIEKEIEGKDPSLVDAQTKRVSEINEQLKIISNNATKETTNQQQAVTTEGGVSEYQGTSEGQQKVGQGEGGQRETTINETDSGDSTIPSKVQEEVATYRAEEQAELLKAIPKIESYKVNGEIDKTLMPKTVLDKYNKIYNKYDKLISPLLETAAPQRVVQEEVVPGTTAKVADVDIVYPTQTQAEERKALRSTTEYVENASKELPVENVDVLSKELDGEFGLLTAENPMAQPLTEEENKQLNQKAEEWLTSKGYNPRRITGKYNQAENSFFVPNLTKQDAIEFAKQFNQESVAHSDGLVYQDGSMNPRVKEDDNLSFSESYSPDSDFVSVANTKDGLKTFSIGYNFDEKIRPEKQATKKIDYKQNLVTLKNSREIASKQDTPLKQKLVKSATMIMKALPGVKVYLHNNQSEMHQALADTTGRDVDNISNEVGNSAGAQIKREIHINMETAKETTILHEAFHEAILRSGKSFQTITDFANGLKNIISDKEVKAKLDEFISMYDESDRAEEFLSELGAIMSEAETELTTTKLQQFLNLINRIAKSLGLPVIMKSSATAQEAVDFINYMSKSLRTGKAIEGDYRGDGKIKKQATEIMKGNESLEDFGLKKGKNITRKIGEALEARQRAKYGTIAQKDNSPEARKKISNWMVDEVKYFVEIMGDKSGKGWYGKLYQKSLDRMSKIFPEMKTDQNARDLFTMLVAITSDGQKVMSNFKLAASAYDYYKKNGVMPNTLPGQRVASFEANLKRINDLLVEYNGDIAAIKENLMEVKSIQDINKERKKEGLEALSTNWPVTFKAPFAASVFGPKLGMFFSNLSGNEAYPTLDRWWSRTFNRYRGTLIPELKSGFTKKGEAIGLDRFKGLLGSPGMSNEEALLASKSYRDSYAAKGYKNGTEVEKAANTIYKTAFENLNDAPFTKNDRQFMYDTISDAVNKLNKQEYDLSIADVQAILWYFEKNLYKTLGVQAKIEGISYEDAANYTYDKWKEAGNKFNYEINESEEGQAVEDEDIDDTEQPSKIKTAEEAPSKIKKQLIGKNANLSQNVRDNLQVARDMEKANKNAKTIRIATGWERGADKKWRYEVPDIKFKKEFEGEFLFPIDKLERIPSGMYVAKLSDLFDAKSLFESYNTELQKELPIYKEDGTISESGVLYNNFIKLEDITVYFKKGGYGEGEYDSITNDINVFFKPGNSTNEEIAITIAHEIQHYIQEREGFSFGTSIGSPSIEAMSVIPKLNALEKEIIKKTKYDSIADLKSDLEKEMDNSIFSETKDYINWEGSRRSLLIEFLKNKNYDGKILKGDLNTPLSEYLKIENQSTKKVGYADYIKYAGEVESRNVEKRINLTPEQRRQTTLQETEDISREDQIIFFGEGTPSKIKLQKTTQETRMDKESEDVFKESLDLGTTWATATQNALDYIQKSKWYQDATDIEREQKVRDFKESKNQKLKKAPSVAKILGTPKPKMVTVNEAAAFKDQLRLEAKAAREAKGDLNFKRKSLSNAIKGMVKLGKLKTTQADTIITRVSKVNLDSSVQVKRLIEYASRVFERANYQDRLNDAFSYKRAIRKLLKTNNQAPVVGMANEFTKLDPSMVENIEEYIDIAEKVKNAVAPSRAKKFTLDKENYFDTDPAKGFDMVLKQAANIEAVSKFVKGELEKQEQQLKDELLATNNDLFESGVLSGNMTAKQIQEIVNALKDPEYKMDSKEKEKYMREYLSKRFESLASIVTDIVKTKKNPVTGENVAIDQKDIDIISDLLKVDLSEMSIRDAVFAVEAMDNFITNGITSKLEGALSAYKGQMGLKKEIKSGKVARALKLYFSKKIGRSLAVESAPLPIMIERMFSGVTSGMSVMDSMGLIVLINGVNKANYLHNKIVDEYYEKFIKNSKTFHTPENVYERGMLSFLKRNVTGSLEEMKAETSRRVRMIEEGIENLINDGNESQKAMAEIYQKVFDKLGVSSGDIDVINARASKENRNAVDWWINQWSKHYQDLSDVSLSVYNYDLGSDINYSSPDRYKTIKTESFDEKLTERNSSFLISMDHMTDKNKTGVLMKANRPPSMPEGRYISFDFDVNNSNSLKGALVDIYTASAIRQVDGFLSSKLLPKLIPNTEDRDALVMRVNRYVRRSKGKIFVPKDLYKDIDDVVNFAASLGVGKALGGALQSVKQTVPIALSTALMTGKFNIATADFNEWLNNTGMPIASRGMESLSTIKSIDRRLDAKSTMVKDSLKSILQVQQMYVKFFLSRPDVFIARSAFQSYYLQYMGESSIDWANHTPNQDALNYAEAMVSRQQNVNDPMLSGEFLTSEEGVKRIAKKILLPFASFGLNQKARLNSDIINSMSKTASAEDRKIARKSALATLAEMFAYRGISVGIGYGFYKAAAAIISGFVGDDDDDDKENDKKWLESATKFPLKSMINDLVSPLQLTDQYVTIGVDYLLSLNTGYTKSELDELVKQENEIRSLKDQDPMTDRQKEKFIQESKNKSIYQIGGNWDPKAGWGMASIAADLYIKIYDDYSLAMTGEFEDDYKGNITIKRIRPIEQALIKNTLIFSGLFAAGVLPKESDQMVTKVVNMVKKNAMSESEYEKYEDFKKEFKREPSPFEMGLIKSDKKYNYISKDIDWVNRKGGLNLAQGREYVKLLNIMGEVTTSTLLQIKAGQTADQISKSMRAKL